MIRIGLISDTHSYLDPKAISHFNDCDEIWHAGDFGNIDLLKQLQNVKPLRGVYGNIDGHEVRAIFGEHLIFSAEGFKIYMTHIGGYPGKYIARAKAIIKQERPHIFICGHSHILKVMRDEAFNNMIVINPGAAGKEGFHRVRTIIKFELHEGKINNLNVIELGLRGAIN